MDAGPVMTMLAPRTDRQQSLHPTPETALVMGRNTTVSDNFVGYQYFSERVPPVTQAWHILVDTNALSTK
jgi:hypothetical protein